MIMPHEFSGRRPCGIAGPPAILYSICGARRPDPAPVDWVSLPALVLCLDAL